MRLRDHQLIVEGVSKGRATAPVATMAEPAAANAAAPASVTPSGGKATATNPANRPAAPPAAVGNLFQFYIAACNQCQVFVGDTGMTRCDQCTLRASNIGHAEYVSDLHRQLQGWELHHHRVPVMHT